MTGDSDDISELAVFGWHNWVWHHHPSMDGTLSKKRLGHCIGPSFSSGAAMCSTVFAEKAPCLNRTSIAPLSVEELNDPSVQESVKKWELHLASVLKERVKGLKEGKDPGQMDLDWDAKPDT
jgi:hypothetical protein